MFSSPQKQAKLLRAMLTFSRRATHLVSRGVPLAQIRALPSIQAMVRAKSTVPNDQPEKLDELARTMAQDMDRLEREFAK
jgi:V/A-type H+-transporting ATPase subunit A